MDTDKLMQWAEQIVTGLYDGPQSQVEGLMCAQVYAQLAIANELKRLNDSVDHEQEIQRQLRDLNYFSK